LQDNSRAMTDAIQTLDDLRSDLPITREFIYLQTGSYAPVPAATQRYMAHWLHEENARLIALGGKGAASTFYQQAETARTTLAHFLGVTAEEVAWSYNTTTATRLAVQSLPWRASDKVALSDVEHASTFELVRGMEQTLGIKTTIIPTGKGQTYDPDYFLAQLDQQLTPDHRLLMLCHVANTDGRRLPVKAAVEMARARGVATLIDGAQAIGVFPVDVGEIGADFYSGSAHKWLMGPAGVGFLVVKRSQLPHYNPIWSPTASEKAISAGTRSEVGTPNHVSRMGAAYSLNLLQQIGLNTLEAQMTRLTRRLRDGLHAIPGIRNAGPAEWALSSSITTLQLDNGTPERCQQLVALLRERYAIVTKFRPEVCGVRVSVAAFNTAAEIDRLLEGLAGLIDEINI